MNNNYKTFFVMKRHIYILVTLITCLFTLPALAQQRVTVTGIVTDETNLGVPGASVWTGSPLRALTSTNNKGEFSVTVDAGATLVFRFIGYLEQSVTLRPGQTTLSVRLREDVNEMEAVVIRGYVARSRELSTGSST